MTNKICDLCSSKIKKGDKIKDIEIDDTDVLYFHSKCLTIKFLELLDDSFELSEMRKNVEKFVEDSKKVLDVQVEDDEGDSKFQEALQAAREALDKTVEEPKKKREKKTKKKIEHILDDDTDEVIKATN
jgi:hypothetical protein